ncbi:hypothetical protein FO519_000235 [Halicephalobus sp. NKZ332]|nr:hypothetical protein FO519_000235 [Halicephalobus sp. NKZ332]
MAYSSNYYNYQVGVIFAILVGAILVLGLVVAAIYFICVLNMRNGKQRAAASTGPLPRRPEYGQPPYSSLTNQPIQSQPEYSVRPAPYTQTTLVQPYNTTIPEDSRVRTLQPEFAYQQGPMTWATMSPVHEAPYPMSPGPVTGGYHMSSV